MVHQSRAVLQSQAQPARGAQDRVARRPSVRVALQLVLHAVQQGRDLVAAAAELGTQLVPDALLVACSPDGIRQVSRGLPRVLYGPHHDVYGFNAH